MVRSKRGSRHVWFPDGEVVMVSFLMHKFKFIFNYC